MDVHSDFLVIGSGIAGLRAALSLAEVGDVVILTKADPRESNTGYAQGGIAAAMGPDDSPELHACDTMAAGDGLCVPAAVDVLVREGPRYVGELIDWGAGPRAGQFLLEIDPQSLEGQLQQGEASVAAARSALLQTRTTVEQARATLDLARQNLRRQDELWQEGLTTREAFERAQNEVTVREAELQTRELN